MTNKKSMSQDDLKLFLNYVVTGQVTDEKQLQRLANRTTTLADVVTVIKALEAIQNNKIVQVMDAIQVQNIILKKLGATEEMFEEASKEYNEMIEKAKKEYEEKFKAAVAAEKEKTEEE